VTGKRWGDGCCGGIRRGRLVVGEGTAGERRSPLHHFPFTNNDSRIFALSSVGVSGADPLRLEGAFFVLWGVIGYFYDWASF